jgi:ribosome-binding ATPase YchF (GTP1/OBG family)
MRASIHKIIVVGILIFVVTIMNAWPANAQDDLQAESEIIKNKRKIFIEEVMELTPQEKEKFWPLYAEFESGLSKIRRERIELALKFIQNHETLSNAEAMAMLKQRWRLDSDELKLKQAYVDKFKQVFPGRKVLRFFQAENKFETAAIAELYGNIPMIR